ncbi:LytR/AlgR family response regulator transcription factor [Mongoliibacter ruber]|uniref:Two-component system LytT family response regulator n=1 Tax=Mongoliibacter ruber TaxID=1750599 RepID=A0A2T0WDJ2_9BACT|nr:LytTR family DNA-binding domain-containing protein [Mongoliibacter ruber]PRY84735.1 two-component system LytT family response regulator [Mongoliibacter ruber]
MNIAIVDDEKHCIESLEMDLETLELGHHIIFKTSKPMEALLELPKLKVDILFLDVEMPLLNGFELLDQLDKIDFDVIFTTAYSEYALQAFKNKAFNFLLKPVDIDELKDVLEDWKKEQQKRSYLLDETAVKDLLSKIKNEGFVKSKIAIPTVNGFEFLKTEDILYCQSENNYTKIFLQTGESKLISKTLKDVEKTLCNYLFLRIHQSYLINPKYLKQYNKTDGGYVIMDNGNSLPVSKQKRHLLIEFYDIISRN